jgi:hypothetical protein
MLAQFPGVPWLNCLVGGFTSFAKEGCKALLCGKPFDKCTWWNGLTGLVFGCIGGIVSGVEEYKEKLWALLCAIGIDVSASSSYAVN